MQYFYSPSYETEWFVLRFPYNWVRFACFPCCRPSFDQIYPKWTSSFSWSPRFSRPASWRRLTSTCPAGLWRRSAWSRRRRPRRQWTRHRQHPSAPRSLPRWLRMCRTLAPSTGQVGISVIPWPGSLGTFRSVPRALDFRRGHFGRLSNANIVVCFVQSPHDKKLWFIFVNDHKEITRAIIGQGILQTENWVPWAVSPRGVNLRGSQTD